MSSCCDPAYEEDEPDCFEEPDAEDRDEFMLACDDPRCIMPGPHFRSECHTVEMLEAWDRQYRKPRPLHKIRKRRQ